MKKYWLILFICFVNLLEGQTNRSSAKIYTLIDQYALAREKQDTVLLKKILTKDIDQLVSTGEWRRGIHVAIQGMLRSSNTSSIPRRLIVDRVKFLTKKTAIADARYEVPNADGSIRSMWSAFVVVHEKGHWRIASIRNMLPSGQ